MGDEQLVPTAWRRPALARRTPLRALADQLGAQLVPGGARGPADPARDPVDQLAARPLVVTGASEDSRRVVPGDLYVALPGAHVHGADFAAQALARGAVAALSDRPVRGLPTLVVPDARRAAGPTAARVHGDPSAHLRVLGVTGTNGKTSTTHLLHAGLVAAGRVAGLLSGVEVRGPRGARASERTTPEADELQSELAALREDGVTDAAVEVSSHGLALHRVDGTRFAAAVFTNLGSDHLDLHGDLEGYYRAKASLFTPDRCGLAVVNTDDPSGCRLAAQAAETGLPVVTFSPRGGSADFAARDARAGAVGTAFRLVGPGVDRVVRLQLLGAHQVDNALGALAALAATGVDVEAAARGAEGLAGVPGRLERVDAGQPFTALVDHAHNTAGQERLFAHLRSVSRGRIHVVMGITGERDPSKRAPLGRTAATWADTVVITDESPHSEDPALLRAAVAAGARAARGARVLVEPDRDAAIALAVACAAPGDVVVVTGRGHDQHLVAAGRSRPFDDRVALRAALRARAA